MPTRVVGHRNRSSRVLRLRAQWARGRVEFTVSQGHGRARAMATAAIIKLAGFFADAQSNDKARAGAVRAA